MVSESHYLKILNDLNRQDKEIKAGRLCRLLGRSIGKT